MNTSDPARRPVQSTPLDETARAVLTEIATQGIEPEADIASYISILTDYRGMCEKEAWYAEAKLVHDVLCQLKKEEEGRQLLQLDLQQQQEMRSLQEAHMAQYKEFNRQWEERMTAFEDEIVQAEAALLQRHSGELAKFHAEFAAQPDTPARAQQRREVLNLRSIEKKLARQKNYTEAARIKAQADALEADDRATTTNARDATFARRESQMLARHRQELQALRGKAERNRASLERARKDGKAQLLQRYQNVRRSLQAQQKILKVKTETLMAKQAASEGVGSGTVSSTAAGSGRAAASAGSVRRPGSKFR